MTLETALHAAQARVVELERWAKFLFIYVRGDRDRTPEYERELRQVFEEQYLPSFRYGSSAAAAIAKPSAGSAMPDGSGEDGEEPS